MADNIDPANISPVSSSAISVSGKSERDVTEFVKYLLEGSGAEANVDFAALRRDLEGTSVNLGEQPSNTNNSSNILDAMSFATSPASKKFYKELSSSSSSTGGGVEINTADQAETPDHHHPPPQLYSKQHSHSEHYYAATRFSQPSSQVSGQATPVAGGASFSTSRYSNTGGGDNNNNSNNNANSSGTPQYSFMATQDDIINAAVAAAAVVGVRSRSSSNTQQQQQQYVQNSMGESNLYRHDNDNPLQQQPPSFSDHTNTERSQSPAERAAALSEVSQRLLSSSFPPLHPSLLFAPVTPYSSTGSLSDRQIEALRKTIDTILDEFDRRGQLVQTLLKKVGESEAEVARLSGAVVELQSRAAFGDKRDVKAMEVLSVANQHAQDTVEGLRLELVQSKAECSGYQARYDQLKKKSEADGNELLRLQNEVDALEEKMEKEKKRNEQTFHEITQQYHRDPNKSGVDRLTLEVIQTYETRMASLHQVIDELRTTAHKPLVATAASVVNKEQSQGDTIDSLDIQDFNIRKQLRDENKKLQDELLDTRVKLGKTQEELELVKLQTATSKRPDWIERELLHAKNGTVSGAGAGALSTRNLIKYDKRVYAMKLFALDAMDIEECRDMLKFVCVKLDVKSIEHLTNTLEDVEKLVRLIPQMQKFIIRIDKLVWSSGSSSTSDQICQINSSSPNRTRDILEQSPPHRLSETLDLVASIAEKAKRLNAESAFTSSVLKRLNASNQEKCLEVIDHLLLITGGSQRDEEAVYAASLLKNFCSLFETTPVDAVKSVKQLYIQNSSIMRSVDTLKNACASVDGTSSSGGPTGTAAGRDIAAATILRAAELLEKLTLTSTTSNTAPVVAAATSPTLPAPQWRLDDSLDQECQV